MRNLKKVLSLALAMVMLLGMMVVGAGAATKYEDDDKIVNKEAVTVVSAIGVLQGVGEGKFNPEGTLTRAEAAVVLAKLDLGADAAAALTATNASTFNDVGVGYGWAKAYIDYCAGRGYIVGDGNGNFLPAKTVSSVEFSAMVLRMLGYRNANEGLTGDSWIINTSALARKSGLTTNVVLSQEGMSRDDMAQMVFNSLTAPTVEYEGMDITIGDVSFNAKAKVRTHSIDVGTNNRFTYDHEEIKPNITPIRLCEEKFPNLKFIRNDEQDNFGRRCSVWTYKGLKVAGSEANITPDLSYTTKLTKETPAEWAKLEGYSPASNLQLWINGQAYDRDPNTATPDIFKIYNSDKKEISISNTRDWIAYWTAAGRSVEVYMNKNNLSVVERVVVVDTVLGEVTKENSDGTYSVKLTKTGTKENPDRVTTGSVTLTAAAESIIGEVKKGDLVLVQGYYNSVGSPEWRLNKDTTIASVEVAPIVTGYATYKGYSDKDKANYIKLDGDDTQYKDAYAVERDFAVQQFSLNTENLDCKLYLDNYGFILKAVPGKDPKAVTDNLIAVKELYDTLTNGKITHMVRGVVSSGETVTWELDSEYAYDGKLTKKVQENEIYTWTRNNGKYTLTSVKDRTYADYLADNPSTRTEDVRTYVANRSSGAINFKTNDVFGKGGANQAGKVMYSDTVKFIFVAPGENGGITILKGRQNYDLEAGHIVAQAFKNDEITAVFIDVDPDVVDVSDLIYVYSRYRLNDQIVDVDGKKVQYHGYTAYDSKANEIEGFLGVTDEMANKFFIAQKTDDGKAYKDYGLDKKAVKEHTFIKGAVAEANGLKGDSLVLVSDTDGKGFNNPFDPKTDKDIHYDFMGNSNTIVKDLSGSKLNIESIAELNDAVNSKKSGGQQQYYVEVAVIYNATDARATQPSSGTVRQAVTVFVTTVCEPDDDHVVPKHEALGIPSVDEPSKPSTDKVAIVANDGVTYTVNGEDSTATSVEVKEGETVTVVATLKKGYEWKDATATGISDKTYTATAKGGQTITIPATQVKPAGNHTLTLGGTVLGTDDVEVMYSTDEGKTWTSVTGKPVTNPDGNKNSYTIPEDATVAVTKASASWSVGVAEMDEVIVDVAAKKLTFTMSKDIDLTGTPAGTMVRFYVADGVKLAWKHTDNSSFEPEMDNGAYLVLATDKFSADVPVIHVASSSTKTDSSIIAAATETVVSTKLYVAPAAQVTATNATVKIGDSAVSSGHYVALGETLTIAPADTFDGVIEGDSSVKSGANVTSHKLVAADVANGYEVSGAWTVTLDGVTSTDVHESGLVNASGTTAITVAVVPTEGGEQDVIKVKNGKWYDTTKQTLNNVVIDEKGLTIAAATEITINGATVYELPNSELGGQLTIANSGTVYVVDGKTVVVAPTTDKKVKVTETTVTTNVVATGSANNERVSIEVGVKKLTADGNI